MLKLTRFDGSKIIVNVDQIEFIEETPDTVISLISNKKILVLENAEQIIDKAVAFKQRIFTREL